MKRQEAWMGWSTGSLKGSLVTALVYEHRRRNIGRSSSNLADPDDFLFSVATSLPLPMGVTVIATVVPEPSGLFFFVIGFGLLCRRMIGLELGEVQSD